MKPTAVSWHRIRLTPQELDGGELHVVQGAFRESFIACNGPRGAALYGTPDPDGGFYLLYFTPEAAACAKALFKAYSAEPCDPPRAGRLDWLCGDEARFSGQGFEF